MFTKWTLWKTVYMKTLDLVCLMVYTKRVCILTGSEKEVRLIDLGCYSPMTESYKYVWVMVTTLVFFTILSVACLPLSRLKYEKSFHCRPLKKKEIVSEKVNDKEWKYRRPVMIKAKYKKILLLLFLKCTKVFIV